MISLVDDSQDRLQRLRLCPGVAIPPALAVRVAVTAATALESKGPTVHDAAGAGDRRQRGAERRAARVENGGVGRMARAPEDSSGVGGEGSGQQAGQVVAQARGWARFLWLRVL